MVVPLSMRRIVLAILLASSTLLAGCFGEGETLVEEEIIENVWTDYVLIDSQSHESLRPFTTVDLRTNQSTNMSWAVFDASKGGNYSPHEGHPSRSTVTLVANIQYGLRQGSRMGHPHSRGLPGCRTMCYLHTNQPRPRRPR